MKYSTFRQIYMNRQMFNIFWIGLSCGIPFLLTTEILDMRLKMAGVSNTVIGLFAILHSPYTFKFLLGPFADKIQLPYFCQKFGQRRGWALFSQILLFFGLVGIAISDPIDELQKLICFIVLSTFANGLQDITLYTYQFDKVKQDDFGTIASVVNIGYKVGMLLSKSSALYIQYYFGWTAAYLVMASSILLSVIFVLQANEPVVLSTKESKTVQKLTNMLLEKERIKNRADKLISKLRVVFFECLICPVKLLMRMKNWQLYMAVITLYKAGDIMLKKMAKVFYLDIGFSILEIANVVQVFGTIASFVGGIIIGIILKSNDLKKCMFYSAIVHALAGFSMLLLVNYGANTALLYVVVLLEVVTGSAMSTCFLAFLYSLCKTGSPTTQYALLWAFHEVVGTVIRSFSGIYADMVSWNTYFMTIPALFIPGIIVLSKLRKLEK